MPVVEKIGRNDPCSCGSGKKHKKCCQNKINEWSVHENAAELINEGRLEDAEMLLTEALSEFDDAVLRNNLATVALEKGEPGRCLDILRPSLDPDSEDLMANPYTLALACRALAALGKHREAYWYLQEAENMFDGVLSGLREDLFDEVEIHSWKEYTVILMKAAAALEDHRRVLEIYERWETEHVSWENHYMAALACFNLEQYRQAASLFGEIGREWSMASQLQRLALLVEEGAIPHFPLEYKLKSRQEMDNMIKGIEREDTYLAEALKDYGFRLILLAMAFASEMGEKGEELLKSIVCLGEEWGEELGRRLLKAPSVSTAVRVAAARGLLEKGVIKPGEPVSMLIDGEEKEIMLEEMAVVGEPDLKTREAMQKASELKESGRLEEAIETLKEVCHKEVCHQGTFFPPATINLSNLLRQVDRLDEAESYLRMVERVAPEEPLLLINMAGLLCEQGRLKEAQQYLDSIKREEADQKLCEVIDLLQKYIAAANLRDIISRSEAMFHEEYENYEEDQRRKIEGKSLSTEANLDRCLRNMPSGWLTMMCVLLGLEPAPRRKEREQQINRALLNKDNLHLLLKENSKAAERQLLHYLLERDGWARLSAVSRKFGTLVGDGFFWEEELPGSPLGMLWAMGLAAVGKANLGKRYEKIALIPMELREPLSELLGMKK